MGWTLVALAVWAVVMFTWYRHAVRNACPSCKGWGTQIDGGPCRTCRGTGKRGARARRDRRKTDALPTVRGDVHYDATGRPWRKGPDGRPVCGVCYGTRYVVDAPEGYVPVPCPDCQPGKAL